MADAAARVARAERPIPLPENYNRLALELADKLNSCVPRRGNFPIPAQLQNFTKFFQSAYRYFDEADKTQIAVSHVADWLLDNFYILEQSVRQVEEDMPRDYYQRLPKTEDAHARIHILALAIAWQEDARLDLEQIKGFLQKFQSVTPLTIGELWAFPSMLRLTLLESLADGLSAITKLPWDASSSSDLWQRMDTSDQTQERPVPETTVVNCILGLRLLATQGWKAFFEATSLVEKTLREDPAKVYAQMDFETRNLCRRAVEELALGSSIDETEIASQAIQLAEAGSSLREKHVGEYLIGQGRRLLETQINYRPKFESFAARWIQKHAALTYIGSVITLTVLFLFILVMYAVQVGGSTAQIILAGILAILPASAAALEIVNWLVVSILPPRTLPKLDFKRGVPAEFSTIVVIPALLSAKQDADFLLRQIERHFLSNTDPNIHFALLTDFADAPEKNMPGDDEPVAYTQAAIKRLNKKYSRKGYRPFLLFHRERLWNESEDCWMGWERKRGKLEEFNQLLGGSDSTSFSVQSGDLSVLPRIRYVITLDADTLLTRESARRLIGALAHPLNQAEFDSASGEVKAGYTVLQPRVQVRPVAANQSLFTRIYSGDSVLDLYTRAVSDVYQELFGEGNYVGKGIYDVAAFRRSLQDRVPDNHLLSHDLFEGVQGRCGLVTDVVWFEDYPPHYLTYTDRLHRWVRGDWQLLPWLGRQAPHRTKGRTPNTLSLIDRWKIFDNMRRSLLSPMALAMLIGGWLFLPGPSLSWMAFALSPYLIPIFTNFFAELRHSFSRQTSGAESHPLRSATLRSFFEVVFLPHESLIILDAITTALMRMCVTHTRMLQWTTAAHSVKVFGKRLKVKTAWQAMIIAPLFAVGLGLLLFFFNPLTLFVAAPLLLGWILSPFIAARISQPDAPTVKKLEPSQERKLRLLARSTWLYFEHFVGPEDRWLPPDHFQESPRGLAAHQTSPTNIGLMLLSTLSAHDLGYIGPLELSLRLRDSFDSMDALPRVRGHFLNWYDTRTFAPLPPRYISTVDNGNLAACLLALRQGCNEMGEKKIVNWDGLLDTLHVLTNALQQTNLGEHVNELRAAIDSLCLQAETLKDESRFSPALLTKLFEDSRAEFENMLFEAIQNTDEEITPDSLQVLSTWIDRLRYHFRHIQFDLHALSPWVLALSAMPDSLDESADTNPELASALTDLRATLPLHPRLRDVAEVCKQAGVILQKAIQLVGEDDQAALDWCRALVSDLESAAAQSASLLESFPVLASRAESFFQDMSFKFLFDPQRRVFHIGYNVETGQLDDNYYDLLASEARTASLIAIARGDVPKSHWLHLARPLTNLNGTRTLLSWSGTMFEYLMPTLFTESYPNTLMDQSCRAAVEQQIRYAAEKNIPWGISEASYYAFDAAQIYQYRAFGVPGLGYKRDLSEDLVVAPYASMLALPFAPQAVMQDLAQFEKLKMWGLYGLYESMDFTPERLKAGEDHAIIRSFMVHHQGMILLALNNQLLEKRMVRRFHADPRIESIELLLQEQTPAHAPIEHPRLQQMDSTRGTYTSIPLDPWQVSPDAPYTPLHCLSNGRYSLLITAAGSGFSRWKDVELTRWRADSTLDQHGSWIYVEERSNGRLWSITHQPTLTPAVRSEVRFFPHYAEFEQQGDDLLLRTTVQVAADDDVEIRRVTLTNHGNSARVLTFTSYAEIILSQQEADQRHPAFNKLFIESEFLPEERLLLFRRRPRSAEEKPLYLAHFFVSKNGSANSTGYETDRARFLGRGGTPQRPAVLNVPNEAAPLSGTIGSTLDPICALQAEVSLTPYATTEIAFVTLAAGSRKEALQLAARYRRWYNLDRAADDTRIQAEKELAQFDLNSRKIEKIQKLLSPLLYPSSALRAAPAVLSANVLGQPGLWSFGVSGDYPILLLRLKNMEHLDLLNETLAAHVYWRRRGLMIDLVILDQRETSYEQEFHNKILRLLNRTGSDAWLNKRGGVFIVHEEQMDDSQRTLLASVARVILDGEAGTLEGQLTRLDADPLHLPRFVAIESPSALTDDLPETERPTDLLFDNGLGGFTRDGREYVIYLAPGQWTPAPWVNVIAAPEFGCLISEAGMGCTWSQNSGENRLTPWRNDPVSDPPSEALYLRDEDTGDIWSPTPLPARADAPYLVRHGAGYSTFEHASHGLEQNVRIFVVPDEPLKIVQLKLHNASTRMRRINVTYYAEWTLGVTRGNIVPEFSSPHSALLARNTYNQDFPERVAFLASTREPLGVTTDRMEFLGKHGNYARPAALERVGLVSRVEPSSDPCAALQLLLWLQPGETKEVTFLLGQGADRAEAERLIRRYQDIQNVASAWQALGGFWDEILGQVQVKTPDAGMNLLLNRWLMYQSLSSRFWGRTAFYQSSGAFGFRDQLQDVMAYIHTRPDLVRGHILDAAAHQFEEGDVLHWWHPPVGRGVRTRCSDDLVWLPYVTAHYVQATGDRSILDEQLPYLSAEPLKADENERYAQFLSTQNGSLYEHCCRALAKGVTAGSHGIPLMGAHDWNDGMNRVGFQGQGESIWLGWFLSAALTDFARICELVDERGQADDYRAQADVILKALDLNGWDDKWYRRAYYDDGSPLGSASNTECQIDSIAQSWSVIAGGGDAARAGQAMESVHNLLVQPADGLIRLLTPPFDRTPRDPGYIKGYPPGVRENGGQYTHAALWTIWASAKLGQTERAAELFHLINPIHHADTPEKMNHYRVEPYVVAADVYSTPPHAGRGGWTWYTGSASWMYRLGLEIILGLQRIGDHLRVTPCIPNGWKEYEIHYRFGATTYHIRVENSQGLERGTSRVVMDGNPLADENIPLLDDHQSHEVVITLG